MTAIARVMALMGPRETGWARVPTVMQQEAVECGAACLAMILAHYGRWVSLEHLRMECGVSRDGTKTTNILKVARSYGLVAKGLKREVEELAKLPFPMILFWSFNHFVVLERITETKAWINDPATGPRTVSLQEIDDKFTGVVLAFDKTEAFEPGGSAPNLMRLVGAKMAEVKGSIGFAVMAGVGLLVPGMVTASAYSIFTDEIMINGERGWLAPLLLGLVAAGLLSGLFTYLQSQSLARAEAAVASNIAVNYFWTVAKLPLSFFGQRYAGDLTNRLTQADAFAGLIASGLAPSVAGLVPIIGFGFALFMVDAVIASVVLALTIGAAVLLIRSARDLEDANRRSVNDQSRLYGLTMQGLSMREDFRASGTETMFLHRWMGAQATVISSDQRMRTRTTLINEGANLLLSVATVLILVVGGLRIMDGVLSIGLLLTAQALLQRFTSPVLGLVNSVTSLQSLRGIADRLNDALNYVGAHSQQEEEAQPAQAAPVVAPDAPAYFFREVSYRYGPEMPPALDGLNLIMKQGQRIALVGRSGSGKSTLSRLLVGIEPPTSGSLKILGHALDKWPREALHDEIAYVGQNTQLFEGSLRDNITLWDKTISEAQYVRAAQDAQIHDFISSRPGGYNFKVLEGGINLSGGEQQRIAIARALAIQPRILILDEATSALDMDTEAKVMEALRRRGCSSVVIAHRLSTIMDSDAIYVLDKGRIVESGTHAALLQSSEIYQHLAQGRQ